MSCSFERQKRITNVNTFQEILDSSNRKPNKIWVDQAGEFYSNIFKRFLKIVKLKFIQHTIKENLLLLKYLLEL